MYVIDGDLSLRHTLGKLIRSTGPQVHLFGTADEFLRWQRPEVPSFVVLDLRLSGMSGLSLQRHLTDNQIQIPMIFIGQEGWTNGRLRGRARNASTT